MARKVKKIYSAGSYDTITHTPLDYYTQTPGNYDIDNYYLRELQDKVDAEWALRPNRVITEYEIEKTFDNQPTAPQTAANQPTPSGTNVYHAPAVPDPVMPYDPYAQNSAGFTPPVAETLPDEDIPF